MTIKNKLVVIFWLFAVLLLFIYSYTQIDLNLTLFKIPVYQHVQVQLIKIGYFNRPLSSIIFVSLVLIFTAFYFYLLKAGVDKKVLKILIVISLVMVFAYPAFSHDIFNYIFDARILVHYQNSPYHSHAWDYTGDNWVRFMHWVHRPFPYGPSWLVGSSLFYLIGLGKFSLTLFSFKGLSYLSYIGSGFFIWKINSIMNKKIAQKSLVYFLFNPVIVFELLVSGHNDGFMMLFVLLSIYLLIMNRTFPAIITFLISVGVKFTSLIYAPVLLLMQNRKIRKKTWKLLINTLIILSLVAVYIIITRRELQPWYLIWPLAIAALIPDSILSKFLSFFSVGAVLSYLPFLYYGNWNPPVPMLKLKILFSFAVMAFLVQGIQVIKAKYEHAK
ncbi:hypothetical protein ACFLZ1_04470 [Patescibacteria group bacterium]